MLFKEKLAHAHAVQVGDILSWTILLFAAIDVDKCITAKQTRKVTVTLVKAVKARWASLEAPEPRIVSNAQPVTSSNDAVKSKTDVATAQAHPIAVNTTNPAEVVPAKIETDVIVSPTSTPAQPKLSKVIGRDNA